MQDVSRHSWGRMVTLRIRRTWEFLQSFEFRHKREKLMLERLQKKKRSLILRFIHPVHGLFGGIKVYSSYQGFLPSDIYLSLSSFYEAWEQRGWLHAHPQSNSAGITLVQVKIPLYMYPQMYANQSKFFCVGGCFPAQPTAVEASNRLHPEEGIKVASLVDATNTLNALCFINARRATVVDDSC